MNQECATARELVQRTRLGDNRAFAELWARYEIPVRILCRQYIGGRLADPAIDEHDLASDTFIRVIHYMDRDGEVPGENQRFKAWLLTVARRTCLSMLQRQARRLELSTRAGFHNSSPVDPGIEQAVQHRESLKAAAVEINALPLIYRTSFKLLIDGYSYIEIAAKLGISPETARKRVERARHTLQPRLAGVLDVKVEAPKQQRAALRRVECALSEIVCPYRIVEIILPSGGHVQLCLRVDAQRASPTLDLSAAQEQLERQPRAWKKRLQLAERFYYAGRWEEAEAEFARVLSRNPRCFDAALRLGRMQEQQNLTADAASTYRTALSQHPLGPLAARIRARLLTVEGEDEAAVDSLREAVCLDPEQIECYYELHQVLGHVSRYEDQLANLAALRAIDPDNLFARTGCYTPCARLNRFDLARTLLEEAVRLDPNDPAAIRHLFQVRMNLNLKDEETLALAQRLVELTPEFVGSWTELAWIYGELGREEESLAVLFEFLNQHPDNAQIHAALAWRYNSLRQDNNREVHVRRAYALEPDDRYICWTTLLAPPTPSTPGEIAARFPRDAFIQERVAAYYRVAGDLDLALLYAERAVALSPASIGPVRELADNLARLQRWEEAVTVYRRLLDVPEGRTVGNLIGLALAMKALGSEDPAGLFREAAALAESTGDILSLASIHAAEGHLDEAVRVYELLLSREPIVTHIRDAAEIGRRQLLAMSSSP